MIELIIAAVAMVTVGPSVSAGINMAGGIARARDQQQQAARIARINAMEAHRALEIRRKGHE